MRHPLIVPFVVAASTSFAHADGAVEEVSGGMSSSSSWVSDKVAGIWDIDELWQLRADVTATRAYIDAATPTQRSGDSLQASASLEYAPDTNWTIRLGAGWSPATTTFAVEAVEADGMPDAQAYLQARASSVSGSFGIGYDTAGTSDQETAINVGVAGSYFAAQQQTLSVAAGDGTMLTTGEVQQYCANHLCDPVLEAALVPQATQLGQLVIDGSISETLYRDTDFTFGAAYYMYDIDPTEAGYFTLASFGPGNLGSAVGIVPTEYTLTPSVAHRVGALTVTGSMAYGSYLGGQGYVLSANLRVQYKLKLDDDRRVKLYAKLGSSWNVDEANQLARSGSLGTGVQYSW